MTWNKREAALRMAFAAGADAYRVGTPADSPPIHVNAAPDLLERWQAGWEWAHQEEQRRNAP